MDRIIDMDGVDVIEGVLPRLSVVSGVQALVSLRGRDRHEIERDVTICDIRSDALDQVVVQAPSRHRKLGGRMALVSLLDHQYSIGRIAGKEIQIRLRG